MISESTLLSVADILESRAADLSKIARPILEVHPNDEHGKSLLARSREIKSWASEIREHLKSINKTEP